MALPLRANSTRTFLPRRVWNGIFAAGDWRAKRDLETISPRRDRKSETTTREASIEAFGFTNPILADPDGHIIAGHGRLQAARAMGFTEVPTITLSGLSEIQKRALRIADNKIALNAGWDLEILQQELGELASIDVDIDPTLTGFSTGEIDVILTTTAEDPDDEVIPPVPTTPRTKRKRHDDPLVRELT
jgi:ParB-like chromosome segregation protein Spo0J